MESKTIKKLLLAAKILISAILLIVILKKVGMQNILVHLQTMDLRYFFLSSAIYVLLVVIGALRWRLLLEDRFSLGRLCSLYFIGSFFNNILPGSIGGDTVKMYYLYQDTGKGGSSFGSVFLDRYIGLFALLTMGLVSGIIAFDELKAVHMQWVTPALFTANIAGSLLFFGFRIGSRFSVIADFYDYSYLYLQRKMVVLKVFFLSIVLQVLSIGMIAIIARGLGQQLSFTALFVFVPVIMIATTLPISISGFGVREGAFVLLFGLVGVPPQESASISFLWFLSVAVTSLVGLVEYIRFRR